jgi:8-oxo-dGTP pyrophosphatase MutT (NUDIX family)
MSDPELLRAAGVICRSPHGRILMVRRTDGEGWAFPGGGIKDGEAPRECAWREFFEETGYRLGDAGKLLMQRVKDGVDFCTFVTDCEDEFVPKLNHEHDQWGWFDPKTVLAEAE